MKNGQSAPNDNVLDFAFLYKILFYEYSYYTSLQSPITVTDHTKSQWHPKYYLVQTGWLAWLILLGTSGLPVFLMKRTSSGGQARPCKQISCLRMCHWCKLVSWPSPPSVRQGDMSLMLQCFGHLIQRANSLEKTLMLGKIKSKRRREWQRMRWLDIITNSMDMNFSKLQKIVEDRGAWRAAVHGSQRVGHDWATEQQQLVGGSEKWQSVWIQRWENWESNAGFVNFSGFYILLHLILYSLT